MTSPAFAELIKDLQQEMSTVGDIKEANRASQFKDHLAMVAEGMGALQWVVFEGKPSDYVAEVIGGVQMFGNRVLKEYREKYGQHLSALPLGMQLLMYVQGPSARRLRSGILRALEAPSKLHPETLQHWCDMEQLCYRSRS